MPYTEARWAAAESLAVDLAQDQDSFTVKLSEHQQLLRIPTPLVILAGLASLSTKETPEQCFTELQQIYNKALVKTKETVTTNCSRSFAWSPNLIPIHPEDRVEMEVWLQQRVIQLEQQSMIQASALVQEEIANEGRVQQKRNKKKKSKHALSSKRDDEDKSDMQSRSSGDSTSGDELLGFLVQKGDSLIRETENETFAANGMESLPRVCLDHDNDENWTMVQRKSTKGGTTTVNEHSSIESTTEINCQEVSASKRPVIHVEKSSNADASKHTEQEGADEIDQKDVPSRALPISTDVLQAPDRVTDLLTTNPSTSPETASKAELVAANARIRELEHQLTISKECMTRERQEHRRALQREQEASQDRTQALQLRLYIAETRLKTFEDALAQHNQTVAINVATPLSATRRRSQSPVSKILPGDS